MLLEPIYIYTYVIAITAIAFKNELAGICEAKFIWSSLEKEDDSRKIAVNCVVRYKFK